MNYYIQGNKEKADQIKAAFEKKGVIRLNGWTCSDKDYIFLSKGSELTAIQYNEDAIYILKTNPGYKELELPIEPKFKVGGIIQFKDNTYKIIGIHDATHNYLIDGGTISFAVQDNYHLVDVKHKFKVGDWICSDNVCEDYRVCKVVKIKDGKYYVESIYGCGGYNTFEIFEKDYRLWTIQDANDGDLLFNDLLFNSTTFIYNGNYDDTFVGAYCGIDASDYFIPGVSRCRWSRVQGVKPATREQRDMLFAKMRDAGYQWDADKKELRKIKPHYDIKNFHAGMSVLVRDTTGKIWQYLLFSHRFKINGKVRFNAGGYGWVQCIPFEGNEHLLGTTDMPDECYINW